MSPQSCSSAIAPIEEIIVEMRAGRMVILVDEEDRENEGDLVLAAGHVSAEAINFMVKHARGLVCLTISEARSKQPWPDTNGAPTTRARTTPPFTHFDSKPPRASPPAFRRRTGRAPSRRR